MKDGIEDDPTLWIESRDKLGRPIDAEILSVARRSWKRVLTFARQQGLDEAVAAGVLERATQTLSSVWGRHPQLRKQVKNLDDYFFWVVAHRLNRRVAKQPPVEYVGSIDDLDLMRASRDSDWVAQFEREFLLEELAGQMDEETRYILDLRAEGGSWNEIARKLGVRRNTAQVKLIRGIEKARKRIMAKLRSTPKQGRPK